MSFTKKELSPLKPTITPSFKDDLEVFHYKKLNKSKTIGTSPNGKSTIPLKKFEGESHNRVRKNGVIVSGDSPIKSPYKTSKVHQQLSLDAKCIDLKNRIDTDYSHYQKNGAIEANHYKTSQAKIEDCISQLKKCYHLEEDKENYLEEFNNYILKGKIYNPFSLKELYTDYDNGFDLAQKKLNQPLVKVELLSERPARKKLNINVNNVSFHEITNEGIGKRERPFDKHSFFTPRSVKLKTKHEDSQVITTNPCLG